MPQMLGKYRLGKTLGEGSYGKMKQAWHTEKGDLPVAIKVFEKETLKKTTSNIKEESSSCTKLEHSNIAKVLEVFNSSSKRFVVYEFASGGSLFNRLEKDKRLPEQTSLTIFRQILDGVGYMHTAGMSHRNLKPENILFHDGDVKIAELGLASLFVPSEKPTGKESIFDAAFDDPHVIVNYAAPEMFNPDGYDGQKADVWGLGVILFVMIIGRLPFEDTDKAAVRAKIKAAEFSFESTSSKALVESGSEGSNLSDKSVPSQVFGSIDSVDNLSLAAVAGLVAVKPSTSSASAASTPESSRGRSAPNSPSFKPLVPSGESVQLSAAVKDLISRILVADPAQRPSLAKILAHPWVTGAPFDANAAEKKLSVQRTPSLFEKLSTPKPMAVDQIHEPQQQQQQQSQQKQPVYEGKSEAKAVCKWSIFIRGLVCILLAVAYPVWDKYQYDITEVLAFSAEVSAVLYAEAVNAVHGSFLGENMTVTVEDDDDEVNATATAWTHIGDIHAVSTYQRQHKAPNGPKLMASRGVGVIELPMAQILGHFLNATEGPKWVDMLVEQNEFEPLPGTAPSASRGWFRADTISSKIIHQVFDFPLGFDHREFVMQRVMKTDKKARTVTFNYTSVEDSRIRPYSSSSSTATTSVAASGDDSSSSASSNNKRVKSIRAETINTHWHFKSIAKDTKTEVEVETIVDLKGSLPKAITNLLQKDWPSKTVNGLRRVAAGQTSAPFQIWK